MSQGLSWPDNLRWLMLWKWAQSWDFVPLFRLDLHPTLLWVGGLGVLAFELAFPAMVLWSRTRLVVALLALMFHAATAWLFNIDFAVLWLCYVVFLPFTVEQPDLVVRRPWRPAAVTAAVLLAGIVTTGALGITQGWPFACYPTFDRPVGRWMPTLQFAAVDADGVERVIPERLLADADRSQPYYGEIWALSGRYGVDSPLARGAFWERVRRRPGVAAIVGDAVEVRFYLADLDVETGLVRRGALLHRVQVIDPR